MVQRGGLRDITNLDETNESATVNTILKPAAIDGRANGNQALPDPQQVTEYVSEIYQYLLEKEAKDDMRIRQNFLENHTEVNARMRTILLDWLIEVHYKFKLLPETLYLCINLIDRYLQKVVDIPKKRLQLLGGTCMLIAAKNEEYRAPELKDICYIMDNAYAKSDVLDMECKVLNTLAFGITTASPLQFLEFYSRNVCGRESELHYLAQFCLECCIVDVELATCLPSQLAAVSLYVASRIMYPTLPTKVVGPYNEEVMHSMENPLLASIANQKDRALGKKYSKERYLNVMQYVRKYE